MSPHFGGNIQVRRAGGAHAHVGLPEEEEEKKVPQGVHQGGQRLLIDEPSRNVVPDNQFRRRNCSNSGKLEPEEAKSLAYGGPGR